VKVSLTIIKEILIAQCGKMQTEAIAALDKSVGRIVKALKETGQLDNTIFVFTADQGKARTKGQDRSL
jgi:membrane-anchored protein YejM (alkaline phosphatase superfamily)